MKTSTHIDPIPSTLYKPRKVFLGLLFFFCALFVFSAIVLYVFFSVHRIADISLFSYVIAFISTWIKAAFFTPGFKWVRGASSHVGSQNTMWDSHTPLKASDAFTRKDTFMDLNSSDITSPTYIFRQDR